MSPELHAAILRVDGEIIRQWTLAVGTPAYVKSRWQDLVAVLWALSTVEGVQAFARVHGFEVKG